MQPSGKSFKKNGHNNPISPNIFCADPSCIVFNDRLYVYGTCDQQQFELSDLKENNTYERIKSLVCFSTDDMTNWTYHGNIDVESICPWLLTSWAPTVIYRKEEDGLTHFYLYFSNSGCGVGVLTSTSPLGPWSSPLNEPLINFDMKELKGTPNPFDPGVCLDDKGDAYLVCGGGLVPGGDYFMPGSVRIVKLGKDLISLGGEFHEIKAPYFFEASNIYFLNGYYIYVYNNNWIERKNWNIKQISSPSACSMSYMISKTPLVTDSWEYKGHFFPNPGEMGLNYSNNHVHLTKFKNHHYILYHSIVSNHSNIGGGYRSICVDDISIDEEKISISMAKGTRKGVESAGCLNPFENVAASTIYNCENIIFDKKKNEFNCVDVKTMRNGAWLEVKNVDFGEGCEKISAIIKGKGLVEIYIDNLSDEKTGCLKCDCEEFLEISALFGIKPKGIHDLYFVFRTESDLFSFRAWKVK